MQADFTEQQAVTDAYNLLMKSMAIIFRDNHKGSYYQSSDADYYESLLTDTKFFKNFDSYLSIIQSSHPELATNSLSTAFNYAELLCNPEQKTIPNYVEPNQLIQEHIWDPIWNFHYAMMSPLREKNWLSRNSGGMSNKELPTSLSLSPGSRDLSAPLDPAGSRTTGIPGDPKNSVHEKKPIPEPPEISKPLELPDELWKHTLSFFGWQHQLRVVKQCSKKLKLLIEDSNLNVPYSTLNYQQRLNKKYIEEYFAKNTLSPANCFTPLSEHSFLTGEGEALYLYDFRNPTKSFIGNPSATFKKLEGHTDTVTSICLLPHNKAVSGSNDKTLRVWDLENGECLKTLQGHTAKINCVIMLNERMMLSADEDNQLLSWDLEHESFEIITTTENPIFHMIKIDDNRIVCATLHDLGIFGLKDKQWIDCVRWQKSTIDSICLTSPDTLLVSVDGNHSLLLNRGSVVRVYDISENCLKIVHDIRHEDRFRFARYMQSLPNGIIAFVSGWEDGSRGYKVLSFYNLTEKKFLASYKLGSMHTYISALPDNRVVLYNGDLTILPFAHLEFKNKVLEMGEPKRNGCPIT